METKKIYGATWFFRPTQNFCGFHGMKSFQFRHRINQRKRRLTFTLKRFATKYLAQENWDNPQRLKKSLWGIIYASTAILTRESLMLNCLRCTQTFLRWRAAAVLNRIATKPVIGRRARERKSLRKKLLFNVFAVISSLKWNVRQHVACATNRISFDFSWWCAALISAKVLMVQFFVFVPAIG